MLESKGRCSDILAIVVAVVLTILVAYWAVLNLSNPAEDLNNNITTMVFILPIVFGIVVVYGAASFIGNATATITSRDNSATYFSVLNQFRE